MRGTGSVRAAQRSACVLLRKQFDAGFVVVCCCCCCCCCFVGVVFVVGVCLVFLVGFKS